MYQAESEDASIPLRSGQKIITGSRESKEGRRREKGEQDQDGRDRREAHRAKRMNRKNQHVVWGIGEPLEGPRHQGCEKLSGHNKNYIN